MTKFEKVYNILCKAYYRGGYCDYDKMVKRLNKMGYNQQVEKAMIILNKSKIIDFKLSKRGLTNSTPCAIIKS